MHNQSKKCQFIGGKYIGGDGYLEKIDQLISSSGDKSREIAVTGSAGMSRLRSTIRAVHIRAVLIRAVGRFSTWRICSREQAKNECDWLVMSSVFVANQSSCFFSLFARTNSPSGKPALKTTLQHRFSRT